MPWVVDGLHGHRFHDDAHPRRRLLVIVLRQVALAICLARNLHSRKQSLACTALLQILIIHYWYTRVSTVFISISGTTFLALSFMLRVLAEVATANNKNHSSNKWFLIFRTFSLGDLIDFLVGSMMIKTITRATFRWWNDTTWIPTVRRAAATHKERASMRLDARTSWRTRGGVSYPIFISSVPNPYF